MNALLLFSYCRLLFLANFSHVCLHARKPLRKQLILQDAPAKY